MTRVDDFFTDTLGDLQASLAGKPWKAGRIAGQTLCKRAGCEKRHIVRKNRIYIHGNQFLHKKVILKERSDRRIYLSCAKEMFRYAQHDIFFYLISKTDFRDAELVFDTNYFQTAAPINADCFLYSAAHIFLHQKIIYFCLPAFTE